MPETNGRTLEQMDHVFKDTNSASEEEERRRIEVEIVNEKGDAVFGA